MSVILKGIDLPKSKDNRYIIQIYSNGEIHIAEEVWDDTKKGHDKLHTRYIGKSEAIQIPKNHGRLIDMDNSMTFHGLDKEYFEECKRKIFEGHGILEAEE